MAVKTERKYIFVVGGVISGVGKGITTSSVAKILQSRGISVTAIKADPYLNVDAGTMNPTEHGEVFVLDDGNETDQDMGNYERFLDTTLSRLNYMTSGCVYQEVIKKERNLEYKGKCVQIVPYVPCEIIRRIERAAEKSDAKVTIIEVGGTAGEYENVLFLEAIRLMKTKKPEDIAVVMVTYLPVPSKVGEMKTKPTQHAVRALNSTGIQPDIIIARSEKPLDKKRKEKIATFCNINIKNVISAPDVESIYDVPLNFEKDKLSDTLLGFLKIEKKYDTANLKEWKIFVTKTKSVKKEINIAVVGKYFNTGDFVLSDSYLSIIEAVKYSAYSQNRKPVIHWLSASEFSDNKKNLQKLKKFDGIIVPGGFGERAIEGKLNVIRFVREHKIPCLGICYGMQLMVVEFARNMAMLTDANTTEVDKKTPYAVVDIMLEQEKKLENKNYGGSMRLGAHKAKLKNETIARKIYGREEISERHRHRYEVNSEYIEVLEKKGLIFSGVSPNGMFMEIMELSKKEHPFFFGTQFHPEFLARPLNPHPVFTEFVKIAKSYKKE